MEDEQKPKWVHGHHTEESLKHWRAWGSWHSWGSATGLSIFLLSIGLFLMQLHWAGLIGA